MAAAEAKSGFPVDRPYYTKAEIDRYLRNFALAHTLDMGLEHVGQRVDALENKIKKINERMLTGKAKDLVKNLTGGRKRKRKKGRRTKKRKSRKKRTKRRKKRTKRRR